MPKNFNSSGVRGLKEFESVFGRSAFCFLGGYSLSCCMTSLGRSVGRPLARLYLDRHFGQAGRRMYITNRGENPFSCVTEERRKMGKKEEKKSKSLFSNNKRREKKRFDFIREKEKKINPSLSLSLSLFSVFISAQSRSAGRFVRDEWMEERSSITFCEWTRRRMRPRSARGGAQTTDLGPDGRTDVKGHSRKTDRHPSDRPTQKTISFLDGERERERVWARATRLEREEETKNFLGRVDPKEEEELSMGRRRRAFRSLCRRLSQALSPHSFIRNTGEWKKKRNKTADKFLKASQGKKIISGKGTHWGRRVKKIWNSLHHLSSVILLESLVSAWAWVSEAGKRGRSIATNDAFLRWAEDDGRTDGRTKGRRKPLFERSWKVGVGWISSATTPDRHTHIGKKS